MSPGPACTGKIFGWVKTVGCGRKLRYIGVARNQARATIAAAAYNLVRMPPSSGGNWQHRALWSEAVLPDRESSEARARSRAQEHRSLA